MMTLLGSSCEDLTLKRALGRSPFKPNLVIFLLVQHQPKLLFPSASSGLSFCSPQSPKPSSSIDPGAEPRPGTGPGKASVSLHPLLLSPDLGSTFRAAAEGLVFPRLFPAQDAQPQNNRGRKRRCPAPRVAGGFPQRRWSSGCFPAAESPLERSLPGPFLPSGISRRCCWDLLSWEGKSQLVPGLPGFALLEEWNLEHLLPGVVPPQGIVVEPPRLQGFAPEWVGGVLGGGSDLLHFLISEHPIWT